MDAVSAAFAAVPRADFLLPRDRGRAAYDGPIPIGRGQTSSQPRTVQAMLRLLEVLPGHRVLDVGAGSGWTTALLAHLTGPRGSVTGLELEPELARWGAQNLARTSLDLSWATVREPEPGTLGDPSRRRPPGRRARSRPGSGRRPGRASARTR
jgi:protein-L-isoaspartate(D-aspartate) O-methyltransferase